MISALEQSMDKLHSSLNILWPEGREESCCKSDGPHFTVNGYDRPVSIGQVEARLLFNLCSLRKVRTAFEIGTGFGYSSLWIASAIVKTYGQNGWVGSLDNYSEGGLGIKGLEFARSSSRSMGLDNIIHYIVGTSPDDIDPSTVPEIDFGFIDGNHNGNQPTRDYRALQTVLSSAGAIAFHDANSRYTVSEAIACAINDGWSPIVFPTSCRICVCYKKEEDFSLAIRAFEAARILQLV